MATAVSQPGASCAPARNDLDPHAHDDWLETVDVSHVKPLDDNWKDHPFWADDEAFKDSGTEAGKIVKEMSSGLTPEERAESCKVREQGAVRNTLVRHASHDQYFAMLSCPCFYVLLAV